jgi:hypothetical protein
VTVMLTMPVPSSTGALRAFEKMKAFMYAHDITKRDQANTAKRKQLHITIIQIHNKLGGGTTTRTSEDSK